MSVPKKKFGIWACLLLALSLLLAPIIIVLSVSLLLATFLANETEAKCNPDQTNVAFLPADTSMSVSPKFEEYQSRFNVYENAEEIKAEQRKIAQMIIGIAKSRGLGEYDTRLGLATAMQESDLQNLNRGHLDSLNMFQQRPSQGWGTPEQLKDPVYAINRFYEAVEKIDGREKLPLIETALLVQRPDPSAYHARWEWDEIAAELAGSTSGAVPSANTAAEQFLLPTDQSCNISATNTTMAISSAQSKLNKPYEWKDPKGYDGSSLTAWAYKTVNTPLPAGADEQFKTGEPVAKDDLKPGDLIFWDKNPTDEKKIDKVAMWMGTDKVLEAADTDQKIRIVPIDWEGYVGAKRPIATPQVIGNKHSGSNAKWQVPLEPGIYEKTSPFSMRFNPVSGVYELHNGVDLAAPEGTPIRSVTAGTVSYTEFQPSPYGGVVTWIQDEEGHNIGYGHQLNRAPHIKVGAKVKAGEVIGYVGSTGGSTGNHLHFYVMTNDSRGVHFIEPEEFMRERGVIL